MTTESPKSIVYRGVGRVKVFAPANRCIYCGTTDGPLTDEHIIPFALGGNMILPQASCQFCQKIINEYSENILLDATRGMLGVSRGRLGLPSRNKRRGKKRREVKPFVTINRADGTQYRKEIEPKAFPLIFNAFESGPPGFVYESMNHPWRPGKEIYLAVKYREDELKKFAGPEKRLSRRSLLTPKPFKG